MEERSEAETKSLLEMKETWASYTLADRDEAVHMVKELWNSPGVQEGASSLVPLFESNVVDKIIGRVVANVLDTHCPLNERIGGNGQNLLITGVRGVGKTTLMRGVCAVLNKLEGDQFLFLYHDVERDHELAATSLLNLLKKTVPDLLGPEEMTMEDAMQVLRDNKYEVAFFLDEIQVLYVAHDHPALLDRRRVVMDILTVGKVARNSFGVLSSSSSNVRAMAYKETPLSQQSEYPNLNDNVYKEYHLSPVREKKELLTVMQQIHPSENFQDEEIEKCFTATGGVGRALRAYISSTSSFHPSNRSRFMEELQHPAFFVLIATLARPMAPNPWDLATLSQQEVQVTIQPHLQIGETFIDKLNSWLDKGFLYRTDRQSYQILVPNDLDFYRQYVHAPDTPTHILLRAAILGTLKGWGPSGTPGGLLERYICQLLCKNTDAWPPLSGIGPIPFGNVVSFKAGQAHTLQSLVNCFFSLAQDCELNGVFICKKRHNNEEENMDKVKEEEKEEKEEQDRDLYELHVLQVKCGLLQRKITAGKKTQLRSNKPNDQVMWGIIAKAINGINALLAQLAGTEGLDAKHFPCSITFTLVTTNVVTQESTQVLQHWIKVNNQPVKCHLVPKDKVLALFSEDLRHIALS